MKRHGFHGLGASHGTQRKHRSPGLHRRLRHPGPGVQGPADGRPDGQRPRHHAEPHRAPRRRGARAAADQGRGSRSPRRSWFWSRALRRAVRVSTVIEVRTTAGRSTVELPADVFDAPANIALMHQVVVGSAGRGPAGHALHEDPRRGSRRRQEAVPAEGHRPGPPGLDPRARSSPAAASCTARTPRDYTQKTPKKMKAAALRGALSDRARAGGCTSSPSLVDGRHAVHEGGARALSEVAGPARRWSCSTGTTSSAG